MAWTISQTYTQVNDYSAKDALSSGNAEKIILGSDIDDELSGISTALNLKLDAGSVASQLEAEGGTDTESIMTPQGVQYWGDANGGMVGDIRALADPGADRVLYWDDSAGAAALLTIGDGIEISDTTMQLPATLAGDGLTLTSGVLAVVGGSGITANANDVALTDAAATTTNPVDVSSGTISLDLTALTTIEGNALAAGDLFLVDDGGTPKGVKKEELGMAVQGSQTSQNLAAADMNTIMQFTGTATLTIPPNATTDLPVGVPVVLQMKHATQELTVTAGAGVTLVSIFHPGGATAASDVVRAGGTALLYQLADNEWALSGDIKGS